jgi:hypothetical protein
MVAGANSQQGLNHESEREVMKKHSVESLKPCDPAPSNIPPKPHVRYVGFEGTEGGRRLGFSVKFIGRESVEVTVEVSDAAFTGTPGISVQDAAPMAFEKIVELLATENTLESNKLCLTDVDIARYITRHLSSQKRVSSRDDRKPPSSVAA